MAELSRVSQRRANELGPNELPVEARAALRPLACWPVSPSVPNGSFVPQSHLQPGRDKKHLSVLVPRIQTLCSPLIICGGQSLQLDFDI